MTAKNQRTAYDERDPSGRRHRADSLRPSRMLPRSDDTGSEFWDARDLQKLLGYSDYRNFLNIVDKGKRSL